MKKIIAIVLIILVLTTLISCGASLNYPLKNRFEFMGYGGATKNNQRLRYYRDTVTDVVYISVYQGLSVMEKADGTPYLWSELIEENSVNNSETES